MPKKKTKESKENARLAAMSYVWIFFIIPLLFKRKDEFVSHHIRQGFVLFVFEIVVTVLGSIPLLGWFIIMPLGMLLAVVLGVLGVVNALQGKMWYIPLLGKFSNRIKS